MECVLCIACCLCVVLLGCILYVSVMILKLIGTNIPKESAEEIIKNGGIVLDFFTRNTVKRRLTFKEKADQWLQAKQSASKEVN